MMMVKFKNGEKTLCTSPTEQKLFKDGAPAGWLLSFGIRENELGSDELDLLLTPENVSELTFVCDNETAEEKELCTLRGYSKITSVILRHGSDTADFKADIQIVKQL